MYPFSEPEPPRFFRLRLRLRLRAKRFGGSGSSSGSDQNVSAPAAPAPAPAPAPHPWEKLYNKLSHWFGAWTYLSACLRPCSLDSQSPSGTSECTSSTAQQALQPLSNQYLRAEKLELITKPIAYHEFSCQSKYTLVSICSTVVVTSHQPPPLSAPTFTPLSSELTRPSRRPAPPGSQRRSRDPARGHIAIARRPTRLRWRHGGGRVGRVRQPSGKIQAGRRIFWQFIFLRAWAKSMLCCVVFFCKGVATKFCRGGTDSQHPSPPTPKI